jgi:biotin synthase
MMEDKNYLIMAASTTHMLSLDKLLRQNGIVTDMVPAPPEYGTVCAIAIKISGKDLAGAESLIKEAGVPISGVFEEKIYALQGLLDRLSSNVLSHGFLNALKKVERGDELVLSEIIALLSAKTEEEKRILFTAADRMRSDMVGDRVDIRGAIEFSNYCDKNCVYCGIRRDNRNLKRYRMSVAEILDVASEIKRFGMNTVILQSGEDGFWAKEDIVSLIRSIKDKTGLRITLSIGERSFEEYKAFKLAGANNFLLKIETTNRELFKALHPDDDFDYRIQCSKWLKELGYLNGSGNIIGLPGQTIEDIAADIMFFKQMGINMIGIGPFMPANGTPLSGYVIGDVDMTLKAVAVTRLVCKNVYIPATTALVSAHPEGQVMALKSGANTIMLVNTPAHYRQNYAIYGNKCPVDLTSAIDAIMKAGRKLPEFLEREENRKVDYDIS